MINDIRIIQYTPRNSSTTTYEQGDIAPSLRVIFGVRETELPLVLHAPSEKFLSCCDHSSLKHWATQHLVDPLERIHHGFHPSFVHLGEEKS